MPVEIDLRRKVEEATRLIDIGKESYGSVAKRFGVGKATVYRWHIDRLTRELEERRRNLKEVEGQLRQLRLDFNSLEGKYREKKESLEEEYKKRKSALEGEIAKLRKEVEIISQQRETMKYVFERRGLTWKHGLALLKKVVVLRAEEARCHVMIKGLTQIANGKKKEIGEIEPTLKRLKLRVAEEQESLSKLSKARFECESWLQIELPVLQQQKQKLMTEVNALESMKKHLTGEFRKFTEENF